MRIKPPYRAKQQLLSLMVAISPKMTRSCLSSTAKIMERKKSKRWRSTNITGIKMNKKTIRKRIQNRFRKKRILMV